VTSFAAISRDFADEPGKLETAIHVEEVTAD